MDRIGKPEKRGRVEGHGACKGTNTFSTPPMEEKGESPSVVMRMSENKKSWENKTRESKELNGKRFPDAVTKKAMPFLPHRQWLHPQRQRLSLRLVISIIPGRRCLCFSLEKARIMMADLFIVWRSSIS